MALKVGPKLDTFVINCAVHDGTCLDTFIDLSTTRTCHLKFSENLQVQFRCSWK
jgi:hypothetical protein